METKKYKELVEQEVHNKYCKDNEKEIKDVKN